MIELKNVTKLYGKGNNEIKALDDIDLIIDKPFTILIGQSGSGKTTLLNMIGCLDTPSSGQVIINGDNVLNYTTDELCDFRNRTLGFVFQNYFLEPNYTVLDNVAMPLILRGVKKNQRVEEVKAILDKVGLLSKIDKKVCELSGGEKQRVAIARALIGNPKIILADEPTGNLDTNNGLEVMELLKKLSLDSKQVIMVTHNLDYIKYADMVINLSDGHIRGNDNEA